MDWWNEWQLHPTPLRAAPRASAQVHIPQKERQKRVFISGHLDSLPTALYCPVDAVNLYVVEGDYRGSVTASSSQYGMNAGYQFARGERLNDIVIGASFESNYFVGFIAAAPRTIIGLLPIQACSRAASFPGRCQQERAERPRPEVSFSADWSLLHLRSVSVYYPSRISWRARRRGGPSVWRR
jgi:hypothetical protein